ncbi:uncharacterized protein LOC125202809 isoform X1 [Salvia hispanica]|uniref:uncharacterized protein LOC125202809 isoform X1 n=1 Tax=Salvia hispanica TaxID=49212 RepID=UPI002009B52E|nr:uncharacterized protein LOC125202809 isoform X1 [Salvia hispanica]
MQRTITHQLNQSIRHELPNPSTSSLLLPRKMEPKDGYPPSFDYGESERRGREWHDDCATDEVLRILRGVINPPFGANLSTDDIAVRVKVMKARYLTFKKVTRTNGAYWNMKEKMVEADASTWKVIFQDNTEVIVLSDSVVPDAPIRGIQFHSPADLHEVTSPMSGPSTRVRRKLFDVGGPCFDEESSTIAPARFKQSAKVVLGSPKRSSCASWSPCSISR